MKSRDDLLEGPDPPHHELRLRPAAPAAPTTIPTMKPDANPPMMANSTAPPHPNKPRSGVVAAFTSALTKYPSHQPAHASMRAAANPALTLIVNAPNNVPIPMIPANASRWTRSSLTSAPTATKTAVPATEPKNKETLRRAVPGSRARVNRAKSRGPNRLGGVARDGAGPLSMDDSLRCSTEDLFQG